MTKKGLQKVRIAQWGGRHIAYMPLYLADKLGLFADEGIAVSVYYAGNDDAIFDEVAAGRAAFGVGDPVFVALGQARGVEARVVASMVTHASMWGITNHPEIKPLTQTSDFVGLRVGTFPRPSTAYTLLAALKKRHGRLLKSMQIVETEIGQAAYLLAAGQVDLILEVEPMVSMALAQGLRLVCNMGDFFPDILFTGLMTLQKTIDEDPRLVQGMVRALQRALTICHTNPERAVAIGRGLFPALSADVMTKAVQHMVDAKGWPLQTAILPRAWENLLRMRVDTGELKKIPPFDAVVNNAFAKTVSL